MASLAPVSVVISTRDRPGLLLDTLESILAGDTLPAEIVVADQSREEPVPLPDPGPVSLVHLRLTSAGLSRSRNAGVAAARRDVLVFTDDDVLVAGDWLRRLTSALEAAPDRTVVTGTVVAAHDEPGHVPSVTSRTRQETFSGRVFADPLFPNNMALRRDAFAAVGLFDERLGAGAEFPAAEDNDFGYRLLEAGFRIAFVPEAVVTHRGARRGRELLKLDWAYGRGQGAFYAKHFRCADRFMLHRFLRNARYRLRRMAPALRGRRSALREAVYLAGLVTGALTWAWRYGGRG